MRTGKASAGIALLRGDGAAREVLLVHPGGPFWAKKDGGAWSLPKGLLDPGEEPLAAAQREFAEEVGHAPPPGPYVALGEVTLKSGKKVIAFAARGDLDPATIKSNEIEVEFPPRSGRMITIESGSICSKTQFGQTVSTPTATNSSTIFLDGTF